MLDECSESLQFSACFPENTHSTAVVLRPKFTLTSQSHLMQIYLQTFTLTVTVSIHKANVKCMQM
jgi:hypothetical protein